MTECVCVLCGRLGKGRSSGWRCSVVASDVTAVCCWFVGLAMVAMKDGVLAYCKFGRELIKKLKVKAHIAGVKERTLYFKIDGHWSGDGSGKSSSRTW